MAIESHGQAEGRTKMRDHLVPHEDEPSPRFFFNNNYDGDNDDDRNYAVVQRPRPGLNRRTYFYTTTGTQTIYTTINCFASSLFNGNAQVCNGRKRREEASWLDQLIELNKEFRSHWPSEENSPTPVLK